MISTSEGNQSCILTTTNSNQDEIFIVQKRMSKMLQVSRRSNFFSSLLEIALSQNFLERAMHFIVIAYLIVPILQLIINAYVHFSLIKNFTLQFIIIATFVSSRVAKLRQQVPLRVKQQEKHILLYLMMIFDLDYIYLITKYPQYTQEILYERSTFLIESNSFIYYNQYMSYLISKGSAYYLISDFNIFLFVFSYAFSLSLLRYKDYYPKQEDQNFFEYLCQKQFALANLHIMSFMTLLIGVILMSSQSFLVIIGYTVFYILSYLFYYIFFSVRNMFILAPIDIPFKVQNIINSKVLEIGLKPYNKGHQFWLLQKLLIIALYIYKISKFLYFKWNQVTLYYCLISCMVVVISIISLKFLYSYYREQKRALYGKNRKFLEINSMKELEDLMIKDLGDKKQFENIKFVHFFNQQDQQSKTSLIISCLFHNFRNAQIIFKGLLYQRTYVLQQHNKNQIINIQDLQQLQYIDFSQKLVDGIQEVKIQTWCVKNDKIFSQLLHNGCQFQITLKTDHITNNQYTTYNKYAATIQKIKHQTIAFQNNICYFILNNPHQILYDLYD